MALGKNLKLIRERRELSQHQLSDLTNNIVSQGVISAIEKRDSKTSQFVGDLAKVLNVTVQTLMYGDGSDDPASGDRTSAINSFDVNIVESSVLIKKCPIISWVRAGELCDVGHIDDLNGAEEWLICGVPHSNKTFGLKVIGDSMSPEYQEGWYIFVDPEVQAQHNDDVIVCDEYGKATFKRLQITPEGTYLLALNPDYPNRILKVPDSSRICGVVIYSGRKRK
jgi:SOS-response transcriptional repressor LexA